MGLFWKKKKKSDMDAVVEWGLKHATDDTTRRYYEAQADKEYQDALARSCALSTEIAETYTVINNVGSFTSEAGDKLIDRCAEAVTLEINLKPKQEYYNNVTLTMSPALKTLSMIFEKREDYENAAAVCVIAIENGFTADGTKGGMRGRLARMIKKGNLPLSDNMKEILNL